MITEKISDVQSGYDLVADEYARRIYDEFRAQGRWIVGCSTGLPSSVRNAGIACDLGCGPGHIARYLHGRGIRGLRHGFV